MSVERWLTKVASCRICGAPIEDFLAFGNMPLANELVDDRVAAEQQDRFPLTLAFCPRCSLVQLRETVAAQRLFRDYVYMSSTSASFVGHAAKLADRLVRERALGRASRVIEIASNDGYLLQHYARRDIAVLGIEPARNIAQIAMNRGIETLPEFFSSALARQLMAQDMAADVVHLHNVLAHVSELTDVAAGVATLLKPEGLAVIEIPYLLDFLDRLEFDTVYHEHLCYFALTPLLRLFENVGLQVFDVERIPVHGGSLRIFVRRLRRQEALPTVSALAEEERRWGVGSIATYQAFAEGVYAFRPILRNFLADLRSKGHSIAAYGASAKGTTLVNYCAIGADLIDFIADLSPLKQGRCLPGVGIPIFAPSELAVRKPDYAVLLAWNFADEIVRQQADYVRLGGRFIVPLPRPVVLPAGSGMP